MGSAVEAVLGAAQRLSTDDQLALIEALSHSLRQRYQCTVPSGAPATAGEAIPSEIARTPAVTDLGLFVTDFWPADETADDINAFVAQQRAEDRHREG